MEKVATSSFQPIRAAQWGVGCGCAIAGYALTMGSGAVAPWIAAIAFGAIGFVSTRRSHAHGERSATGENTQGSHATRVSLDSDEVLRARAMEIRSRERTALLDALVDGVLLVDAHGETRFANAAAIAMLGERASIAGTRDALDTLPIQVKRAVAAVVASHGSERRRIECELNGDSALPVVVIVSRLQTPHTHGGSVMKVDMKVDMKGDELASVVIRDIRAEREADRMKSDFVAQANHELRTPLTSLRATAELFADGEIVTKEECAQFGQIILEHADRLANIVDNMLDIRRIESGMARASFEEVDLVQLVGLCVDEQAGEAQRRRISMSIARAVTNATAQADRALLKQVVLNLLSNALKYTPEGGTVTIDVDTDNLARAIVVSVRDNGPGIPEQAQPRLFGKFYRVESLQKVAKGTGLGLNLCRNVVETMHGGQIGVDSQVGVGSRFWFAIPISQTGRQAA